jgi:predicted O-methyltransferase YrrM
MKRMRYSTVLLSLTVVIVAFTAIPVTAQEAGQEQDLDRRVQDLLQRKRNTWRDMNVPMVDGQKLYDLVVENGYTKAVEVGTSTGHSAIWIAWALSKTGGKLITIEIDERRYRQAVANFEEAGLSEYIDARLADAHELVPQLEGPFDFMFVDADKNWYVQYFRSLYPHLEVGGCFTAHNIREYSGRGGYGRRGRGGMSGTSELLTELRNTPDLETEVFSSGGGLAISFRKPPTPR